MRTPSSVGHRVSAMIRALVVVLCLLAQSLAAPRVARLRQTGGGRIIGGTEASVSDYPWQLSLQSFGSHSCGASVISADWALTAAHCVSGSLKLFMSIRAGTSTRESGGTVLSVSTYQANSGYDAYTIDYDVAVVQVSSSFPLGDNVQIVSLPDDGYDPPAGLAVTVTGWGNTHTDLGSPIDLQKVDISVLDRGTCADMLAEFGPVTDRMVCAGQAGQSVCHGDSGGPLVSGSTQVGIVSWGNPDCVSAGAAYSNVGNLRSWIRSNSGV